MSAAQEVSDAIYKAAQEATEGGLCLLDARGEPVRKISAELVGIGETLDSVQARLGAVATQLEEEVLAAATAGSEKIETAEATLASAIEGAENDHALSGLEHYITAKENAQDACSDVRELAVHVLRLAAHAANLSSQLDSIARHCLYDDPTIGGGGMITAAEQAGAHVALGNDELDAYRATL